MMKKAIILAGLIFIAALTPVKHAAAQDEEKKEEAKERFKKGLMFVDEGDCKKALVEFREAYAIFPAPVILYNMALCYDTMHQYGKAMKFYTDYLENAKDLSNEDRKKIEDRMSKLEKFLGTMDLVCNVDGASVIVDGSEIGKTPMEAMYLETGDHKVTVKKEEYLDYKEDITVVSGKTAMVVVNLEPSPEEDGTGVSEDDEEETEEETDTKRKKVPAVAFWSMLGATVGLGVGAGVIGGLNTVNHKKFKDAEDDDKKEDLQKKGELYNILFLSLAGAAGAAAVTTVVLSFFTDFKKIGKREKENIDVSFVPLHQGGLVVISAPIGGVSW